MAQTPKSVSANLIGGTASTLYTVPSSTTAVVKTALGQNVVGSSSSFTLQKLSSGTYYPLIIGQNPQTTFATGGTTWNSQNLLNGPVTLAAGESLVAYDSATPYYKFPITNNAVSLASGGTFTGRSFIYGNSVYIQVGSDSVTSKSAVFRSTDGNTWTEIATGNLLDSSQTYYMRNIGSTWVITTWATPVLMYSTDNGLTWTKTSVASGKNITCMDASSSTFVIATTTGLYTSTNGSVWTANTGYNTFIGNTISNNNYTPQGVFWNGTYWFISNNIGCCYTSDLTNFTAIFSLGGGRSFTGNGTKWSTAYSKWYSCTYSSTTAYYDYIFSSTNGISWSRYTWTGTETLGASGCQMACAGSNSVILACPANSSITMLKSTDGSTWARANDIKSWSGPCIGMENGYFVKSNTYSSTQSQAYITTDPTTSTGNTFNFLDSSSILIDAASNGTGWVAVYYNANNNSAYCAYGSNGNTITNSTTVVYSGAAPTSIVWWPALSIYVASILNSTRVYYSSTGATWTVATGSYNYGYSYGSLAVVGNYLYLSGYDNSQGYVQYWTTDTFNSQSAALISTGSTYSPHWNSGSGYSMNNLVQNPSGSLNMPVVSNGTVVMFNTTSYSSGTTLLNPSIDPNKYLTPGSCGLSVERVNGNDIIYPCLSPNNSYTGYGFSYSTDITSSVTNAKYLGQGIQYLYNSSPFTYSTVYNMFTYYSGQYWLQTDLAYNYIYTNSSLGGNWNGAQTQISTSTIGGIGSVYCVVQYMNQKSYTDGTNFIKYGGNVASVQVYKGTSPSSTKASSVLSLGLVEIT